MTTEQVPTNTVSINLCPPEQTLDGKYLDQLIELWLEHVRTTCCEATAENYTYKIIFFRHWWGTVGPNQQWQLGRRDLLRFRRYLADEARSIWGRPLSYSTQHDALRRLRQMFNWAQAEGFITSVDCRAWVPHADGEEPRRKAVPMAALERLFAVADTSQYPERDRAILAALIGTGVRRSECASIQAQDVRIDGDQSGLLKVTGKRTRNNRTGIRDVAFDAVTGGFLRVHLAVSGIRQGALFRTDRGARLSAQGIYKVVKRCVLAAQLEGTIQGCHDLRRAFATHFAKRFRGAVHADILRRQMGHSTYRMTSHYTLWEPEDYQHEIESPMTLFADDGEIKKG